MNRSIHTREATEHGLACFHLDDAAFGIGIRFVREIGSHSRLVILETDDELGEPRDLGLSTSEDKFGLLVDRISDVKRPDASDLEPPPANPNAGSEFLSGVCKLDGHTLGVLDPSRLLRCDATDEP